MISASKVFEDYVRAAGEASSDIEFLLEHLDVKISLDWSEESLARLEDLYWQIHDGVVELPDGMMDVDGFLGLLTRYLGQCVVARTGARWVQAQEKNRRDGQPCLDGFGNAPWERIYPIELSKNFRTLRETNPDFPGVQERKVLATQLRQALQVAGRAKDSGGHSPKRR